MFYLERVDALAAVADLEATCVFVSHHGGAQRHIDYVCSDSYLGFMDDLATELGLVWDVGVGLSLSGLQMAYAGMNQRIPTVICQSPSAWWNDEWLARQPSPRSGRFWISVGSKELEEGVSHPPTGMRQEVNQLDSCRRLAEAIEADEVTFRTFDGGHDPRCWAEELPEAMEWASRRRR